jgi:hypothetical protein
MKIKHKHIRDALIAWSTHPGGRKMPAAAIAEAYFALGMTKPLLHDDVHPEALNRNTQKIFRWVESDTPASQAKIQQLLPAIIKAMPDELSNHLLVSRSIEYRAIQNVRDSLNHSLAALNKLSAVLVGTIAVDLLGNQSESGASDNSITMH